MSNVPDFSIKQARLVFKFKLVRDLNLTTFLGIAVRGSFGKELRQLCCITGTYAIECRDCKRFESCLYRRIFEPVLPDLGGAEEKYFAQQKLPVPYIIRFAPGNYVKEIKSGRNIYIELVLMGPALEHSEIVVKAMLNAARWGFGIPNACLSLVEIKQEKCSGDFRTIYSPSRHKVEVVEKEDYILSDNCSPCSAVVLKLITPLKLRSKNKNDKKLDFELLMRNVFRRLDALGRAYGSGPLQVEFKTLLEQASNVNMINDVSHIKLKPLRRFSYRQGQEIFLDGIIGSCVFEGELTPLMPFLKMAQNFSVGRGVSLGLGAIEVREIGSGIGRLETGEE